MTLRRRCSDASTGVIDRLDMRHRGTRGRSQRARSFAARRPRLQLLNAVVWLIASAVASQALAQADYAREKRWADEVVPGIIVGDAVQLDSASGRKFLGIYAPAQPPSGLAVVVVHGLGMHPDWNLINVLRSQLADQGYSTLSIQMPVLAADAKADRYGPLLPEAGERLAAAVKFLQGKGHSKVGIVSHSYGARMANYFVDRTGAAGVSAWVAIGITEPYTGAERFRVPVLDIYEERDYPAVRDNAPVRAESLRRVRGSAQIEVPEADHFFNGHESELVRHIKTFLDRRLR